MRSCFGEYFNDDEACAHFIHHSDLAWAEADRRIADPNLEWDEEYFSRKREMYKVYEQMVEERKAGKNKKEGHLLIDEFIEMAPNHEWLLDNINIMVIAGFHTSATSKNEEIQERLVTEIANVLGEEDIYASAIAKLSYTKEVIQEGLRHSVLVPYAARYAEADVRIGGYHVPKGTPILHAIGAAGRNEKAWKNPETFDPDRFSMANNPEYLKCPSFGFAGNRKCPGWRFALMTANTTLSVLLRRFKLQLADNQQEFVHTFGLVTYPAKEIHIKITERKSQ